MLLNETLTNEKLKSLPIMQIGEIADSIKIHQRTLRLYDEAGILCPQRTSKNRRKYTVKDFEQLELILFLTRNLGLNIMGVKILLATLNKTSIKAKNRLKFMKDVAFEAGITESIQKTNIEKYAKRGRRSNLKRNL